MNKLIYTILSLCFCCFVYAQQKILGGQAIDISQAPYQVFVSVNGGTYGGGVIINDQWILTAKHVVEDCSASDLSIAMGYTNPLKDPEKSKVSQIICHSSGDIALLKLAQPIIFNNTQKPIKISNRSNYPNNTLGTVTGWGRIYIDINGPVSQLYRCNVVIESCTESELIAKISQSTPYKGDSGGPLVSNTDNTLIGIVSRGSGQSPTTEPTKYTNVGTYYNWISQYVDLYNISGPDLVCNSASFDYSAPGNCVITTSPNVEIISKDETSLLLKANSPGNSYVAIEVNGSVISSCFFWSKEPIITGVASNGSNLTAVTPSGDASIIYTEWTVGSNIFTSNSATLSCPYSSGTYNVSVKARNNCGTSTIYNGQVSISNYRKRYDLSVLSGTKQVRVIPIKEQTIDVLGEKKETNMNYQLINTSSGTIAANGNISSEGGLLDFSDVVSGIYILRLEIEEGMVENFKFILK